MSAVLNAAVVKTFPCLPNHGYMSGRLGARRTVTLKQGKRFLQLMALEAPDRFSMPGLVEIQSVKPVGEDGDLWSGYVRLSGYPNNYETKADKDGVIGTIHSSRAIFEVVEGS